MERARHHPPSALTELSKKFPNPFERRQFAFRVLPEEKDPMSRAFSAVVAATLDKALNQLTRDEAAKNTDNYRTKLLGLQRPTINERKRTKSRCLNLYELENFSRLTPDDLALLIILFRTLDQNILEFENILHDIHHIGEYIAKMNEKTFILNSLNNEQLFLHQQRLKIMINTLNKILHDLTDEDEVFSPFEGEEKTPDHLHDLQLIYQSIGEKFVKIETKLKKSPFHSEENQHHLHLLARLKEKFYKNISKKKE